VSTVLVTGATGFLGEFVIARLRAGADRVVVFARPASNIAALVAQGVEVRSGDLGDQASLRRALAGVDVLVNLASLGFGHAPTIVAAAANAGLQHAVFVSTTSIYSSLPAGSKPTRIAAEQAVRDSGLPYTLLRPTMIYGSPRDRNIWRLIKYLSRWPAVPLVGDGSALQQPVFVDDVAQAVVAALHSPAARGSEYNLAGGTRLSFAQLLREVCAQLGRKVAMVRVPERVAVAVARGLQQLGLGISAEQVLRLQENKVFDCSAAQRDLCYTARAFEVGLAQEIEWLRRPPPMPD